MGVYSYMGSKVLIKVDDIVADNYNRAMDEWFAAQERFEIDNGRKITQEEIIDGKLQLRLTPAEFASYNAIADFMNKQIEKGLILTEEDCPSDKLIKVDVVEEVEAE